MCFCALTVVIVTIQKVMSALFVLIRNYSAEIDVFNAFEDMVFHFGVLLLYFGNQLLYLHAL